MGKTRVTKKTYVMSLMEQYSAGFVMFILFVASGYLHAKELYGWSHVTLMLCAVIALLIRAEFTLELREPIEVDEEESK